MLLCVREALNHPLKEVDAQAQIPPAMQAVATLVMLWEGASARDDRAT
ncbi:hypothetical protein Q8G38_14495 [Halomonas venusta]|nr:hypothetical protein [Halomonas venusta]MDW0360527.1 hypothetical protein [Halomonas venusta]